MQSLETSEQVVKFPLFAKGDDQGFPNPVYLGGQMAFRYTVIDTEFGWVALVASPGGIRRITLPQPGPDKALDLIRNIIPNASPNSFSLSDLTFRLQCYFRGDRLDFFDEVDIEGATPFHLKVWELTRTIPYGLYRTYGWLAREVGSEGGARAVGQALARNPLPIIIPCHRVIGANGNLGGYSGGTELKKRLLEMELGRSLTKSPALNIDQ